LHLVKLIAIEYISISPVCPVPVRYVSRPVYVFLLVSSMILLDIFMYDHLHILKLSNVAEFPGDLIHNVVDQVGPRDRNVAESKLPNVWQFKLYDVVEFNKDV